MTDTPNSGTVSVSRETLARWRKLLLMADFESVPGEIQGVLAQPAEQQQEPEKCRVATCSQPAQHGRKYCRWDSDKTEDDLNLCGIVSDLEDDGAPIEAQESAVADYWLMRKLNGIEP